MTLVQYLETWPHPWFDTTNYSLTQVLIFFAGAILWVVAYIDAIINIVKKKTIVIPVIAVCLNFGYEVTAALFFLPDMGLAVVCGYWAWMVLDIFIIYHAYKYGDSQIVIPYLKKHFKYFFLLGAVIAFFVQYFFITNYDMPMAPFDGYMINLIMSLCFIYMVFIPGYRGNSLLTAWTKFLGTGLISIMFQTRYPENYFLTTLYISTAVFDILYIYLLYQLKKGTLFNSNES